MVNSTIKGVADENGIGTPQIEDAASNDAGNRNPVEGLEEQWRR